jgi:glycosyltransferase involved in cell wall biosynthesis
MRILENPTELAPIGGVELSMLQVAGLLAERGHSINALYQKPGSDLEHWQQITDRLQQVPGFDCRQQSFLTDLVRLPAGVRAARTMSPDVVYLNRAEQIVWGVLAAKFARAPLVVHLRTHLRFPGVRMAGRLPAQFIAVSDFVRNEWVAAGVPADKVTVVHNGIELARYPAGDLADRARARALLGLPADSYVVLYYGRVSPGKGVGTLLDAWRTLDLDPAAAQLVIMGGSPDGQGTPYEQQLLADRPVGCRWLPMDPDVIPALHAADVVVLPAEWQEPFGRVVIEGLATGRPVIGTEVGGIPEILTGEFSRFLVEPGNSASLAAKLTSLANWRSADPGLGERCTDHVRQNFSLSKTVDGVEAVLAAAAGLPSPRRAEGKVKEAQR